jgi:uncharacterized membrane protein
MHSILLVSSVFLASIVEGIEALTIVLAIGTTRGWRSTWYGVVVASVVLAIFIAILGPALMLIPINVLRLVVGGLLLTFGLQWLRKAILRASGFIPFHDEAAIFNKTTIESKKVKYTKKQAITVDWYAFTISFKGVLLEGLEVAFIIVTFGASQGSISLAIVAAIVAILLVIALGIKIHKPLSTIPENTLKFVVGIMLTSFGIFWGSEGAGIHWPGSDAALLYILILITATALTQVAWMKRRHARIGVKAQKI